MNIVGALGVVALVAAALVAGYAARIGRTPAPRWLEAVTHQRVLVHTTEDQTLDALLLESYDQGLVLGDVRFLQPPLGLAGQIWIAREKVRYVQAPEA